MPKSGPPQEPISPAPLNASEARIINDAVRRFYGDDAIVRNYGPDPKRLRLHVEVAKVPGLEQHECLGLIMCDIVRDQISLVVTKRGEKLRGEAKIAYRQGDII